MFQQILQKKDGTAWLGSYSTGEGQVADSCEQCNETLVSIKGVKFDCQATRSISRVLLHGAVYLIGPKFQFKIKYLHNGVDKFSGLLGCKMTHIAS
jgi:hypothetical protein